MLAPSRPGTARKSQAGGAIIAESDLAGIIVATDLALRIRRDVLGTDLLKENDREETVLRGTHARPTLGVTDLTGIDMIVAVECCKSASMP